MKFALRAFLLPASLALLATASTVGCGNFAVNGLWDREGIDPGPAPGGNGGNDFASGGAGGGGGAGASDGGASTALLPYNDSYSYLCGGNDPLCHAGTDDCTQGGDPHMGGNNDDPDPSALGCQLDAPNGTTIAICGPVGTFGESDPCATAADCSSGLGCAATASGGLCRAYCCGNVEECPKETYCAPVPMANLPTPIPVCTPTTPCELLNDATCPNGQTCAIVRSHGVTSCVDPGPNQLDEPCPCAAGLFCSKVTKSCVKLCHTDGNYDECGNGAECYGGVDDLYPPGYGICIAY